jgi:hypothetical protein
MTTIINGFTVLPYGSAALGTYLVPGTGVRLSVRREVAPLLIGLALDYHHTVEPLHPGWCWGHNPRKIAGSTSWSLHAPGIAVDLNAPHHPMGRRGTFTTAQRAAITRLLAKYTHRGTRLVRWGGTYTSRPDEMHFELIAPRAVCLAAVAALQAPAKHPATPTATPVAKPAAHPPGSRLLTLHDPVMSGEDVAFLQGFIGPQQCGPADGDYGARTEAGVRWYQRMRGITADGQVGPATWRQMGIHPTF